MKHFGCDDKTLGSFLSACTARYYLAASLYILDLFVRKFALKGTKHKVRPRCISFHILVYEEFALLGTKYKVRTTLVHLFSYSCL